MENRARRYSHGPLVSAVVVIALTSAACAGFETGDSRVEEDLTVRLDEALTRELAKHGFTGRIESTLESRLGRPIDRRLALVGRMLFFDKILSLRGDNSCAGCHAPTHGFGDTQPIAIGIESNDLVGDGRRGPRNQRRSPSVINTIFYPALMWTPRFTALSGDPFHSPQGFQFPPPEGVITDEPTLLAAQASIPSTELVEMAGFCEACKYGVVDDRMCAFDDGIGEPLPPPAADGTFNAAIQAVVDARLNANEIYRALFADGFGQAGEITISMRRRAIAEFQTSLTAADAPLDRFARGDLAALTNAQKRGALVFFGKAGCVECHAVSGTANEMFSDFKPHRIGGPQLAPVFGVGTGNVIYDGPSQNEDFGFEQVTGDPAQRYTFRTAPLRNLKVARAFFHNGAFGTLAAAIRHHLDPTTSLRTYDARANRVPDDLSVGPAEPMLAAGLDPKLRPVNLGASELADLVDFVENGLLDPKAVDLCAFVPSAVPSSSPLSTFEGCD
jgi:cytochrome c peroxidase